MPHPTEKTVPLTHFGSLMSKEHFEFAWEETGFYLIAIF